MKIIDAHLHFCVNEQYFFDIAKKAGHENSAEHLFSEYKRLNIVAGVVMGNREDMDYPSPLLYCVGVERFEEFKADKENHLKHIEKHFQNANCVGVKLYPGYDAFYVYDDALSSLYELCLRYKKPIAVHTGLTASANALLKYSHPLTIDEAATKFPQNNFVICHLGEPWFIDAIAVMMKNPNVAADLSGMLEGKIADYDEFLNVEKYFIDELYGRLRAFNGYNRLMFGTDWPLANLEDYIFFTKKIIPKDYWNLVFFDNANRIYNLL